MSHDYGLDGEIEVFAELRATGQRFPLQLKGTDSTRRDALRVTLDVSTCEYYRSLDAPVLLVRYVAPTDSLYVAWFHSLDCDPKSQDQKTMTFGLDAEEHLWEDETPQVLLRGFKAFRRFRSPSISLPIPFELNYVSPTIFGRAATVVGQAVRAAARELPGVIEFPPAPLPESTPTLSLSEDAIVVDLSGVASLTLPLEGVYGEEDPHTTFALDALLVVALTLANLRHSHTAADLITVFGSRSRIVREGVVAVHVANVFAHTHRVTDALDLADYMDGSSDETLRFSSHYIMMLLLTRIDGFSESERVRYRVFLENRIAHAEERGDNHEIAIANYNFANYIRGRAPDKVPLHHYLAARRYWPPYCDYSYYCRELAGVLFEAGKYDLAVHFYERAFELGDEFPMLGVYGDALLFCGRYEDARAVFSRCNELPDESTPEWRLKELWLDSALSLVVSGTQVRQAERADEVAQAAEAHPAAPQREQLRRALELDLLCDRAWFGLGLLDEAVENRASAFGNFLGAALSNKWNVTSWCNTLLQVVNDPHEEVAPVVADVAMCAYRFHGDHVLDVMVEIADAQPAGFPKGEFLSMMESFVRLAPDPTPVDIPPIAPRASHMTLDLHPELPDDED